MYLIVSSTLLVIPFFLCSAAAFKGCGGDHVKKYTWMKVLGLELKSCKKAESMDRIGNFVPRRQASPVIFNLKHEMSAGNIAVAA